MSSLRKLESVLFQLSVINRQSLIIAGTALVLKRLFERQEVSNDDRKVSEK